MKIRLIFSAAFAFGIAAHAQDTWTQLNSGTTTNLLSISCTSINTCYAFGGSGLILKTTNGGINWTTQTSGVTNALWGSHCPANDTCFAVGSGRGFAGQGRTILRTVNGGLAWSILDTTSSGGNLFGVSCLNTSNCVAVGTGGWVTLTTNGGATWTGASRSSSDLYAVQFTSATTLCAVGGTTGATVGTVLFNTNGGAGAWSSRPIDTLSILYGLHFLNADTGWVVGSHGVIRKTTNGGSWTKQNAGITFDFHAVHFVNPNSGYAAGPNIFKTTNSGTSWGIQPNTVASFYSISFPDTLTAYAVGQNGAIFKLARPVPILTAKPLNSSSRKLGLFWLGNEIFTHEESKIFDLRGRQLPVQPIISTLPVPLQ